MFVGKHGKRPHGAGRGTGQLAIVPHRCKGKRKCRVRAERAIDLYQNRIGWPIIGRQEKGLDFSIAKVYKLFRQLVRA